MPVFDHGELLRVSVGAALAQTVGELEVMIVGDGATEPTRQTALALCEADPRVRFLDFPKGPRRGELNRHAALAEARGRAVFYLSDQDLWLEDHVETLLGLLESFTFVSARPVHVSPDGRLSGYLGTFDDPRYRAWMEAHRANFVSLSSCAHTLELYRSLPFGWRTTPEGVWTDLYMWNQFLAHPGCRPRQAAHPTLLVFPAIDRPGWTVEQRLEELAGWKARLAHGGRAAMERAFSDALFVQGTDAMISALHHEGSAAALELARARLAEQLAAAEGSLRSMAEERHRDSERATAAEARLAAAQAELCGVRGLFEETLRRVEAAGADRARSLERASALQASVDAALARAGELEAALQAQRRELERCAHALDEAQRRGDEARARVALLENSATWRARERAMQVPLARELLTLVVRAVSRR